MSHIFISYSHRDNDFAHTLASSLQSKGFDVWIDVRLDYGSQWPYEIQKHLDSCDAFILLMTPRSFESQWVQLDGDVEFEIDASIKDASLVISMTSESWSVRELRMLFP